MAEIKVKYNFIKTTPRKIREVIDLIRIKKVAFAQEQLKFLNKSAARPVSELLNSAWAAAREKDLLEDDLYIKEIRADEGPRLKRRRLQSRGRAATVRKRMTHLTLILSDKGESKIPNPKSETKSNVQNPKQPKKKV